MTSIPRRSFLAGAGSSALLTAGCANGVNSGGPEKIDARVAATMNYLFQQYPHTVDLHQKSKGALVMPLVTKAGFGVGAAYGRGALQVDNVSIDYYSAASGSIGLQIGAQQYSHALFFMNDRALADFRKSPGWEAGADAEFVLSDTAENASADTTTAFHPVIALIFAQAGIAAGATLKGTKYTRIIP